MSEYVLRLTRDRLDAGARYGQSLPSMNRILYVLGGDLTVEGGGKQVPIAANSAWHGAGPCTAVAGRQGATVLRYELVRSGTPPTAAAGAGSMPRRPHAAPPAPRAAPR